MYSLSSPLDRSLRNARSWIGRSFVKICLCRLFQIEKGLKPLFLRLSKKDASRLDNSMDHHMLKAHALVVMQSLGAAVESLEDSRLLTDTLSSLGHTHVGYNVKPGMLLVSGVVYNYIYRVCDRCSELGGVTLLLSGRIIRLNCVCGSGGGQGDKVGPPFKKLRLAAAIRPLTLRT